MTHSLVMSAHHLWVAATSDDGTFQPPTVDHEFNPPGIFATLFGIDAGPFEMNRIIMVRIIGVATMMLLMWLAFRSPKLVPSRGQSVAEMAMDFVNDQIAVDVLGERLGRRYLPLLATIFFATLAMNLTGLIPGLNIAGTSTIAMPLVMGLVAYVAFISAGIRELGGLKFLRSTLFPPGVPWPVYFLLTPIEVFSVFVMRPLSLALRLFLAMMVGHLLLVLCFTATHFLLFTAGGVAGLFGVVTFAGGLFMSLLELLVAVLQAYVFTLLTATYIQQSVSEAH